MSTLPPSWEGCLEIWKPQPPETFRACPRLYRDFLTFTFTFLKYTEKNTNLWLSHLLLCQKRHLKCATSLLTLRTCWCSLFVLCYQLCQHYQAHATSLVRHACCYQQDPAHESTQPQLGHSYDGVRWKAMHLCSALTQSNSNAQVLSTTGIKGNIKHTLCSRHTTSALLLSSCVGKNRSTQWWEGFTGNRNWR